MRWTDEQTALVKELSFKRGLHPTSIAKRMGLRPDQVSSKLFWLRFPRNAYAGMGFGEQLRTQRLEAEALRAKKGDGADGAISRV